MMAKRVPSGMIRTIGADVVGVWRTFNGPRFGPPTNTRPLIPTRTMLGGAPGHSTAAPTGTTTLLVGMGVAVAGDALVVAVLVGLVTKLVKPNRALNGCAQTIAGLFDTPAIAGNVPIFVGLVPF